VVGVGGCWPVLARRYACISCKGAKGEAKKRTFTALHPDILAQLSSAFRLQRDMFVVRRKVCIEKDLLRLVNALTMRCGFEFMEKAIGSVQFGDFLGQGNAYMSHCIDSLDHLGDHGEFGEFGGFGDENGYDGHILKRRVMAAGYLADHERRYPAMMAYMESLSGDMWMVDHTFWCCKHVSVRVPVSDGINCCVRLL
jgi:hypothetical protein